MRSAWSDLLGDPDHPGLLRRILNKFRKWTVPELMVGNPIQLLDRVEEFGSDLSPDEAPFVIRNELIDSVNRRIRVNRGAEKLSLTEIKELVLQDARVQRAVRESALKDGVTEEKIKKRAEAYVDEIAADPRTINHHCLYYVLKFLFWKVFDGIDIKTSEFNSLKKANQNGSLIYVSSHKSHFDYLLIGYLSFINQMSIPYMAAGKNLAFWPVGTVLRTCAAFFIRRTFKGLSLYTHVFAAYLKVLVKEKVNINFYIEGGRSRTGKLMQPRTGMLSFLLQTVDEGAVQDLLFVPSYIGYDLVPEEKSYLKELSGKEKQKETLSQFIRAREVLKRKFGRAYVRFHEPISYKQFCEDILGKDHDPSMKENRKLLQEFADYMMHCLVKVSVVTPVELAATSLASAGSKTIYRSDIYRNAELIMRVLRQNNSEIAPSLKNLEPALDNAIDLFLSSKILLPEDSESDSQHKVIINPNRRANLEFYKNALLNQLWPYSFCAMILLNPAGPGIRSELIAKFEILMKLFHKELMYDPISSANKYVDSAMDFFQNSGWVREDGPGEASILNEKPLRLLREVFEDITRTYYYVCTASRDLDKSHSIKDYIKLMSKTAQLDKPDEPAPHFLTVTTENALSKFSEMGIFEYKHAKKVLVSVVEPEQRDNYMQVLNGMRSR
jgi:glycerol-3-phosphate O-acyltransferase